MLPQSRTPEVDDADGFRTKILQGEEMSRAGKNDGGEGVAASSQLN